MMRITIWVLYLMAAISYAKARKESSGSSLIKRSTRQCPFCFCGTGFGPRVVGGNATIIDLHPWLVALNNRRKDKIFCSSTLISDSYSLTAAHCVRGIEPSIVEALLLDTTRLIAKFIPHKKFAMGGKFSNDVALVKFDRPIDFTASFSTPICLPRPDINLEGRKGVVVGWGKISEYDNSYGLMLNEATVPLIEPQMCRLFYNYEDIDDSNICAGYIVGGVDACQGDSGGPLTVIENKRQTIIGIVSWGIGCARPLKPGVYAGVSKYTMWIIENTIDSCFCY